MTFRGVLVAAALLFAPASARAETTFLPADARAIPRSTSASRDAPVVEIAYGPRAYGSLGFAHGALSKDSWRLGVYAVVAYENDTSSSALPKWVLARDFEGLTSAWAMPETAKRWFGPESMLELALAVGRERAHQDAGATVDAYRTTDIPFGGGGWSVAPDVAVRLAVSKNVKLVSRIGDRIFVNAFPLWLGQREASNVVASYLEEGLVHEPWTELVLSWHAGSLATPIVAVHAEGMVAHDDSARDGVLVRGVLGLALPGAAGTLMPFASGEAGNGKGLFINRRELRLSVGVRLWFGGGTP